MPKSRQKISCKKTSGTVVSKKMTEKLNIEDTDEIIEADAEMFFLLFEKPFNKYHKKKLKEKNLDCEYGVVTEFLTKITKKIKEHIVSDAQGSKRAKFLKIMDSFFQSLCNSK